jgi:spermidine synthase
MKFCHRHLQSTRLTVVEIDPNIIELREWFHIPADDERLRIILGDDFYPQACGCLGPEGVLVMNLAGERRRYVAHLERLREACPGPVLLVPVQADGNVLIFAFAQPTRAWTLESAEATAEELQSDLALEFPRFLQRLRTGHLL